MDTPPEEAELMRILVELRQRVEDLERAERILREQRSKLETECIALRERCERLDYERWRLQMEKDRTILGQR